MPRVTILGQHQRGLALTDQQRIPEVNIFEVTALLPVEEIKYSTELALP